MGADTCGHVWAAGRCEVCRLTESDRWVEGADGAPVHVILWTSPEGRAVRVLAMPPMLGDRSSSVGLPRAADVLRGVPVGPMPQCPGHPDAEAGPDRLSA